MALQYITCFEKITATCIGHGTTTCSLPCHYDHQQETKLCEYETLMGFITTSPLTPCMYFPRLGTLALTKWFCI